MSVLLTAPPPPAETIARVQPGAPDHISPTAAKSYLTCSLRFYFERVLQLVKPTSPALHLGKAVHAALQRFHLALWRGEDHSPEAVSQAYSDAFSALERDEGPVKWTDKKIAKPQSTRSR